MKDKLNEHKRSYTGVKPYECNTYKKPLSQNIGLASRASIHLGEKSHRCEMCEKNFKSEW